MKRIKLDKVADYSTPLVSHRNGVTTKASFASAKDIMAHASPQDFVTSGLDTKTLWDRKLREAKSPEGRSANLFAGISANGYDETKPVTLSFGNHSPVIVDGHHRIAAMSRINPDKPLPIKWQD